MGKNKKAHIGLDKLIDHYWTTIQDANPDRWEKNVNLLRKNGLLPGAPVHGFDEPEEDHDSVMGRENNNGINIITTIHHNVDDNVLYYIRYLFTDVEQDGNLNFITNFDE